MGGSRAEPGGGTLTGLGPWVRHGHKAEGVPAALPLPVDLALSGGGPWAGGGGGGAVAWPLSLQLHLPNELLPPALSAGAEARA